MVLFSVDCDGCDCASASSWEDGELEGRSPLIMRASLMCTLLRWGLVISSGYDHVKENSSLLNTLN